MARQNNKLPFVRVDSGIKRSLMEGHPWVYRDAVERAQKGLSSGQWVHVQCGNQQYYGLWDASDAIAIRLFNSRKRPNRTWVVDRIKQAWDLRAPLRDPHAQISAYRWLYGESDGLPGVVADLYGDVDSEDGSGGASEECWVVLRTYSESTAAIQEWVVDGLQEVAPVAGIVQRDGQSHELLAGREPPQPLTISERGLLYEADLLQGQKTGFFLDQRENRHTLGEWSQGRRVLNLFAYTGGFSVSAAKGGAVAVTSVDIAQPAMEAAERNFRLNNIDPAAHEFIVTDCFDILQKYYSEGRRFDLIIVDPPSFARSRAQLDKALHAYQRLNTLAMQCLDRGGLLASSSCTSQVSPDAFKQMLASAAVDAKAQLLILHEAGQPLDHPVPAHFPEARYLKFVIAAVTEARS